MRTHPGLRLRWLRLGVGVGLIVALGGAPSAMARDANGSASCMGIERSAIAPPGTSDEEPGGAAQLNGEVRAIAAAFGVPPGAIFGVIAHLHEGSHEACDEALE